MTRPAARPRVEWRTVDGILLLDKPLGLSSNQALQRARRLYRAAKAGHTGSLDPLATGVLALCFGQATKVAGLLLESDKTYRAAVALGRRTSTGDREGAVTETGPVPQLEPATVRAALARFVGELEQLPPMYSALKRDGEALYALARRGIEVERARRTVRIRRLELDRLEGERLEFTVTCSKGTYVRTLGEDIAAALGTCGHLAALERTEIGAFAGATAHTLEALERLAGDEPALDALLRPVDSALANYPAVTLGAADADRFRHGQVVADAQPNLNALTPGSDVRVYDEQRGFLGMGTVGEGGAEIRVSRLMSATAVALA